MEIPFDGAHQAGVLTERPPQTIFVALDAIAPTRADLADGLYALSQHARRLTQGYRALIGSPAEGPTPDTGIVGPQVAPDALTVTIGFGASLFDARYGLGPRRPPGLTLMPTFPDDALVAEECHGDVSLQLCAGTQETLLNALRELMRASRATLAARWKVEGFLPARRESGASRNLLGFKDGTANPDPADDALMRRLVWDDDGGTFQVARIIRNRVEFWDRVARSEQELMIGRDKVTGAPLGRRAETDDPQLADDPKGDADPAGQPHPPGPPAHARDRGSAHPAPPLQLLARRSTSAASSTWGCCSSPTTATRPGSSRRSSSAWPARAWSTTSCRPAGATSTSRAGPTTRQDWVGSRLLRS